MGHRRQAREVALQVLYQIDVSKIDAEEAIELYCENFDVQENVREFSTELILGTRKHIDEIDDFIGNCSEHWTLDRMARVDKNILRMAVYELLYCRDIPPKATLNEAIDIGKIYGTENSGSFINGILDALYVKLRKNDEDNNLVGTDRHSEP
jgi:N utilization substance protein B